jgi:hypothetical protein
MLSTSSTTPASPHVWTQRQDTIIWQQGLGGTYSVSPVFADGRIDCQSEEEVTTLIAPGREFHKLATNRPEDATPASMAVSGGSIYIRSDAHLYRIRRAPVAEGT